MNWFAGRVTHHFAHQFYRLDRHYVKPSGRAYFKCSVRQCKARFVRKSSFDCKRLKFQENRDLSGCLLPTLAKNGAMKKSQYQISQLCPMRKAIKCPTEHCIQFKLVSEWLRNSGSDAKRRSRRIRWRQCQEFMRKNSQEWRINSVMETTWMSSRLSARHWIHFHPVSTGISLHHLHHHHHHEIFSWRSACIPPTPETQEEVDLDTRYLFYWRFVC